MKFRKKPVIIEAEQWDGWSNTMRGICRCIRNPKVHVHTAHNNQLVVLEKGDWIIPEPNGVNFYPCKPDIFEATYEKVED